SPGDRGLRGVWFAGSTSGAASQQWNGSRSGVAAQAIVGPQAALGPIGVPVATTARTASSSVGSSPAALPAAAIQPQGNVLGADFSTSASGLNARHVLLLFAAASAILPLGLPSLPRAR